MTTWQDVLDARWALDLLLNAETDVDEIVDAQERLLLLHLDYVLTCRAPPEVAKESHD